MLLGMLALSNNINPPTHSKLPFDVLCGNLNMDESHETPSSIWVFCNFKPEKRLLGKGTAVSR
jgi:hypothetical protein